MTEQEKYKWDNVLKILPNEVLQYINSKSNELLLQQYQQEQKEQSQYSSDLATALMLLGKRQSISTKSVLLSLLQKCSGIHYDFSKLIAKINKGTHS